MVREEELQANERQLDLKQNEKKVTDGEMGNGYAVKIAASKIAAIMSDDDNGSEAAEPDANVDPGAPILQFSTECYYVKEGEEKEMIIDVIRLGNDSVRSSCTYSTRDSSAKAGVKYKSCSGELTFEVGESMKQITIPILSAQEWNATLEFEVKLSQAKNALLGKYLYLCKVKIIDSDAFPTNRFKKEVLAEDYSSINMFALFKEYVQMNLLNKTVKTGSIKVVAGSQIDNGFLFWRLILTKALIDKILSTKPDSCPEGGYVLFDSFLDCPQDPDSKVHLLVTFAILLILPFALVHLFDYRKTFWKIGGTSRKTLQGNLLRKYLNYDRESRDNVKMSDLSMAMSQDAFDLVGKGYMQLFPLSANLGKLLTVVILQIYMGLSKKNADPTKLLIPLSAVVFFPIPLFAFLFIRNPKSNRARSAEYDKKNNLVDHVDKVFRDFRLIADYEKKTIAVNKYEAKIGQFNGASTQAAAISVTNKYFAPWLSIALCSGWFMVGGAQVVHGDILIGEFLTTLSIIREVGKAWSALYNIMLTLQDALVPLKNITMYMNKPTDVSARMSLNRRRRQLGEQQRIMARDMNENEEADAATYPVDTIPIKFSGVSYKYTSKLLDSGSAKTVTGIQDCTFEFNQGSFVALVGEPGQGKCTLLKLLGGVLLPNEGDLLVPPHLRVLHVSHDPFFRQDTLFQNMIYGVKPGDPDASNERVVNICKKLGITDNVLEFLDPKSDKFEVIPSSWNEVLSLTQRVLLHHARALIMNPELMVMHKPTTAFDENQAHRLYSCIKAYIQERGLGLDPEKRDLRRPRTCVITTSRVGGLEAADKVFHVTKTGVTEAKKDRITKDASLLG